MKQSRSLSCESASACSLLRAAGFACADDMTVFNALPQSYDNPHRGFVGPVDSEAGSLPPGAAQEKVGGYGAYVEPLQAGLAALGVTARYTYDANLDALRALLDQGTPAMIIATHGLGMYGHQPVGFVPQDGGGEAVTVIRYEHSYAVVGYDAGGFWLIDPWSGSLDYADSARLDADWARLGRQALWLAPG
ncbi:MAG: C39 family peptidase [Anaerolineae bacterium]|nr:C39 family peptidase [Anaerolineae bacterium]